MIVVNRQDFMAWTVGIFLERKSDKSLIVGDKPIHEKAKEAMDKGETIGLIDGGQIVSHMKLTDDGYKEFAIED